MRGQMTVTPRKYSTSSEGSGRGQMTVTPRKNSTLDWKREHCSAAAAAAAVQDGEK